MYENAFVGNFSNVIYFKTGLRSIQNFITVPTIPNLTPEKIPTTPKVYFWGLLGFAF